LFGLFPLRCQSANGKAPNELGIPTGEVFFNRILLTEAERARSGDLCPPQRKLEP
jgi:hypothetical protein